MKTYDYYCTWQAQNIFCQEKGIIHRDYLDEEALFGKRGLVFAYPEVRKDLYFVLDDGWDVPYSYNVKEEYIFGSHEIRKDRFPSLKGKPQDKLKAMVDKITSYGWKGVGIWVCAQGNGKFYKKSVQGLKNFFKKRLEWSKFANVSYWKVDWGVYGNDRKYRKMLTSLASKVYPELIIENAMCIPPVNGFNDNEEEGMKYVFPWNTNMKKYVDSVVKFSEVFRSYDVTEELSVTSTLARLSYLLKQKYCLVNCEDELYIGAILGCPIGIQRNSICKVDNITPKSSFHYRANESLAAMRYRSISSCFAGTKLHISKESFFVEYPFGPYWSSSVDNQVVKQLCPCRLSRNTSLPKVSKIKEVPYVICCKDFNNNYALGTFKLLNDDHDDKYLVNVSVMIDDCVDNIAIFSNHIKTLKVNFKKDINYNNFILVDLINNTSIDISKKVKINNNKLIIPYEKLTAGFACDDLSGKAYMIKLSK